MEAPPPSPEPRAGVRRNPESNGNASGIAKAWVGAAAISLASLVAMFALFACFALASLFSFFAVAGVEASQDRRDRQTGRALEAPSPSTDAERRR